MSHYVAVDRRFDPKFPRRLDWDSAGLIPTPCGDEPQRKGNNRQGNRGGRSHRFSRCSAIIAARTAACGLSTGGSCSTAKYRRFVLPSIGEDQAYARVAVA